MKIYDAHVHIGVDYFLHDIKGEREFNLPLKGLLKRMRENGVEKSIALWCPSIKEIACCAPTNLVKKGDKIASVCPVCKKTVALLDHDPYRPYNLKMIEWIRENKAEDKIMPFFIIHMQNPFIREEVEFYADNYGKFGLKFHTFVSRTSMMQIKEQLSGFHYPVLAHTGPEEFTHPKTVIAFARQYKGNVLLAHAARLSAKYLEEANSVKNLFVDVSPLTSFYNRIVTSDYSTILEDKEVFRGIDSPEAIYHYLLRHIDYRKLLFGTDAPWCDKFGLGYDVEVKTLKGLKLEKREKEAIANGNFSRFADF